MKDQTIHVRIAGVDAPEVSTSHGQRRTLRMTVLSFHRARITVVPGNLTPKRAWRGLENVSRGKHSVVN